MCTVGVDESFSIYLLLLQFPLHKFLQIEGLIFSGWGGKFMVLRTGSVKYVIDHYIIYKIYSNKYKQF